MLNEESQAQTQREEDELNKLAVKRNKIIAIVINVVFAVLFCTVAVLAFFNETSVPAFITCCVLSCLWTFVYNKFAHSKLLKESKKYAYIYIVLAILVCAVTLFTHYKLPEEVIFVRFTEGTTLKDILPWVIAVKGVCDCGVGLGLGFVFW